MRILLVLAHPLPQSFAAAVARTARETLQARGHGVDLLDLYQEGFDPRLSAAERAGYFDTPYDVSAVAGLVARLRAAEGLVLVFPQWWFGFPAILKGFLDRVLAPGVAFSHDTTGGRIIPQLRNIRLLWALTTTGSPWWMVRLYLVDGPALYGRSGPPAPAARHRARLREGAELPDPQPARHGPGERCGPQGLPLAGAEGAVEDLNPGMPDPRLHPRLPLPCDGLGEISKNRRKECFRSDPRNPA